MTYDLSRELDKARIRTRIDALMQRGAVVDLSERAQRTRSQNAYLHKLIGVVALETGNTMEYCKEVYFKRIANAPLFVIRKEDKLAGTVEILRSSADLSKEEMTEAIDRFKRWGAENGFYLPNPGDEALLKEIETEIARMRAYL